MRGRKAFALAGFFVLTTTANAGITPPSSLTATAISSSAIDLAWQDNNRNETGFEIERSLNGTSFALIGTTNPDVHTYRNSGLAAGTRYYYRVRAKGAGNKRSSYSNVASATTVAAVDTTPPSVPTGTVATASSCTQIDLAWNSSFDSGSGVRSYKIYRDGVFVREVLSPTTFTSDTGRIESTSYSYAVSALDNAGNESARGTAVSRATLGCAPPTPSGLTATVASCSQVNLAWNAVTDTGGSGLKGYNLYRNGVFFRQVLSPALSTADTGLAASTTYSYRVAAIDNKNNTSAQSAAVNATTSSCAGTTTTTRAPTTTTTRATTTSTTLADSTAPSVPTGLTTSPISCSRIDLSWNASSDGGSGVRGYHLYRNTVFFRTVYAPSLSTSDTGLAASTTYTYRVSAFDFAGNVSAQSTAKSANTGSCATTTTTTTRSTTSTTAPDNTDPSVPQGLTATPVTCTQINLAWNASTDTGGSGLRGYNVYRNNVFVRQVLAPTTSSADTGLTPSTVYSYRVSAVDNAGNESNKSGIASGNTPACGDTTAPSVPTGVTATAVSCSQVDVRWNASSDSGGSGLQRYDVYRNGTFLKQVIAPATTTSDTGAGASTTYSYTVRAFDNAGNTSALSSPGSTTTPSCVSGGGVLRWAKNFGGNAATSANAAATDSSGNIAVTGSFEGTVNFGGGSLSTAGNSDIFVAKYTSSGQHLWSRRMGAGSLDAGTGVAVDGSGNVLVTGYFYGTVDFGGGPLSSAGASDAFVAKYSSTGQHLWSRRVGGVSSDAGRGVGVDTSGNVVATGAFVGTADFGGGPLSGSGTTMWIAKYAASNGAHLWSRASGGGGEGRGVAIDGGGNALVTGYILGGTNLGGAALASAGVSDVFVAKYSSTGAHVWSRSFGGADYDQGNGVAVDGSGNVIVTGRFRSTMNAGGSNLVSQGADDVFVVKYSSAGAHTWSKRFGGTYGDSGNAVDVDTGGNVAITGYFEGTADFGGGALVTTVGREIVVAKYSSAGAHTWSRRFGGHAADQGYGVSFDGAGNVNAVGMFAYNFVDYGGPELTTQGLGDMVLISIGP